MSGGGGAFFDQFIEDYLAECDEHLATIRRVLLELEEAATGAAPAPPLHELFRSLHTLKGLSGMVGDECAERVAHALEDMLRAVQRAGAPAVADRELLDVLFAGVDALERCIAAHRAGAPRPDVDGVLASLVALAPAEPTPPPDAAALLDHDIGADTIVFQFEFVPSAALTARGVGVDAVRGRLRSLGTLLDARPRVVPGGVAFDFRVAIPFGVRPDESWLADGLRWTVVRSGGGEGVSAPTARSESDASAAAAATRGAPGGAASGGGSNLVRVDLARLDDVMRLVADLVVSRSRLDEALRGLPPGLPSAALDVLGQTNAAMERQLRQLREGVMRIRLVPIGEVFERLRFAARDAIRESGKQVRLVFHGQSTEIDKVVVDRMLEPLLHLVRNAVSHGIERPEDRVAVGKPAEGTLELRATAVGDRIQLVVTDDGAGIDVDAVARRARTRGLLDEAGSLGQDDLLDVLCAPGLSTREQADRTSGRGVGMDVVRSAVRALSGELAVETAPGRGTTFTIELPLTLMILDALLVDVGGQQMTVPQPALREILQVDTASIVTFENNEVVRYRDGVLPIVHLARLFAFPIVEAASCYLLVVGTDAAPMGLRVDRLVGLREVVVHPVADPLVAMPGVAGATDLGNDTVSLILDVAALLRLAEAQRAERAATRLAGTRRDASHRPLHSTV